ncbi:hypothetical protein BDV95DRAFT_487463 [Massariosphaeria phaeospora]|uniref:NmrA-like domain-containing protein n=1 Tax=Massariosphaeria phaeospora TaxID=100035 RepID=A0A7C8IEU0_9PLEO|nr:hypothetical protein BDV95DRAFT_487463 [Massariosphaeria phaeospora]
MPPIHQQILLIGAGELGSAFLPHLSTLPNTHITVGVRSVAKYTHLTNPNVSLLSLDITGPSQELAQTFAKYDILISATGFGQDAGAVTKLAKEALEAGKLRKEAGTSKLWFFPWQWGVDYDVTGDGQGLMPLFGEQVGVRELLRAEAKESHVKWTIVSTGIFMSFLFEQLWGIVDRDGDKITVRALRDWNHRVTVTDVNDIGNVLARIVTGDAEADDRVVYCAGDTVSYAQLADIIQRVKKQDVKREQWSVQHLESELAKDPSDTLKKYRLVFAKDGVYWEKESTVNHKLNISLIDVGTYARKILAG